MVVDSADAQAEEFDEFESRTIITAIFGNPTEADLRAAFAVFDRDG